MKIFPVSQIKEIDDFTIQNEPISSEKLMERASAKFTDALVKEVPYGKKIWIFAGPGNNGGDAKVIAQLLEQKGYNIQLFSQINENFSFPDICSNDIIVDGLFGAGINRSLSGIYAKLVQHLNQSGAKIYAIDIPSGLFGEDNSTNDPNAIIRAYKTFTFQMPKLSFLFSENYIYTGEWEILEIGLHPEIIESKQTNYYFSEKKDIAPLLKKRNRFAHKGNFGHVLLLAGSLGKCGAAVLAAKACLCTGAGLLTCHIPQCGLDILQTAVPEAMAIPDSNKYSLSKLPDIQTYNAIGVGPGIGICNETHSILHQLLEESNCPLVIDADALNIISENHSLSKMIPSKSVLTPHPKEFDRLAGKSNNSFERLQKAISLAEKLQSYIILKGAYTAICTPEKHVYFNSTGNPGMATAGSGDVLTGILSGFLAQSYDPENAAKSGVYIHGLAGDLAAKDKSQESLTASDLISYLGKAFLEF